MSRSLKITIIAVFMAAFVLAVPLTTQAADPPSLEITGVPADVSCTGGSPHVPVYINLPFPASDSAVMSVAGVGVVSTYAEDLPIIVGSGSYVIPFAAFSVPNGTPITITITTYNAPGQSGGIAHISTVVYECGTGTLISLNGVRPGAGPDMYPLPDYAVVGTFTQNTALFFAPQTGAETDTVMEIGKSLWVIGINEAGTFYKVLLSGQPAWVPVGTIGPTYDDTWNGTPLPTEVVN